MMHFWKQRVGNALCWIVVVGRLVILGTDWQFSAFFYKLGKGYFVEDE